MSELTEARKHQILAEMCAIDASERTKWFQALTEPERDVAIGYLVAMKFASPGPSPAIDKWAALVVRMDCNE